MAPDQEENDVDVALVVVHGIGQQLRGGTLVEWAEPLFERLDALSRRKTFGGAEITSATITGDSPAEVRISVGIADGKTRTISITEARWAESFIVQPPDAVIFWSITFVVKVLLRVLSHMIRLARLLRPWDFFDPRGIVTAWKLRNTPEAERKDIYDKGDILWVIIPRLFASATGLAATLSVLVGGVIGLAAMAVIFWLVPVIAWIALLLLALLSRLPWFGPRLKPALASLTSLIGDASVFTSSPIAAAAMRDVVRTSVKDARASADRVIVLAHSQGAAIAARAIARPSTPDYAKADALITVGAATALLRGPLFGSSQDPRWRPVAAWAQGYELPWINMWGVWDPVAAGPVVDRRPQGLGSRWRRPWRITESGWRWREFRLRDKRIKAEIERRFHEQSEVVPLGLSREARHELFTAKAEERKRINAHLDTLDPEWLAKFSGTFGPEEHAVSNRGSLLADHATYSSNVIEVVDPIARQLLGGEFLTADRLPDRVLERRRHAAGVTSLAQNRFFAAALTLLLAPTAIALVDQYGLVGLTMDYGAKMNKTVATVVDYVSQLNAGSAVIVSAILLLVFALLSAPLTLIWKHVYERALIDARTGWRLWLSIGAFHAVRVAIPAACYLIILRWAFASPYETWVVVVIGSGGFVVISLLAFWAALIEPIGAAPLRRKEQQLTTAIDVIGSPAVGEPESR